jgi:hypothetical protein
MFDYYLESSDVDAVIPPFLARYGSVSSSLYEINRASPTGGRRPFPFNRDLMGLSLSYGSVSLLCLVVSFLLFIEAHWTVLTIIL